MTTKRAVVFTGLIRNKDKFSDLIAYKREMGERDIEWVFSTWEREYHANQTQILEAARAGFNVVVCDEPPILGYGHINHQKLSLKNALDALSGNPLVLKSRIDFFDRDLTTRALSLREMPAGPGAVFVNRVYLHSFFLTLPYYINDIFFAGSKTDLEQFCGLDIVAQERMANVGPEQLFHSPPFYRRNSLLRDFMAMNFGLAMTNDRTGDFQDFLANNRYFLSVLATYYADLFNNYASLSDWATDMSGLERMSCREFLFEPAPGFEIHGLSGNKMALSVDMLAALAARARNDDSLGYLAQAMIDIAAGQPISNAPDDRDSFRIMASVIAGKTNARKLAPVRTQIEGGGSVTAIHRASSWTVQSGGPDTVSTLQTELSFLRRQIERLERGRSTQDAPKDDQAQDKDR